MIEIKNLDFSYQKNKKLFHKVDLNFAPGKIIGVLGRNGAGKTTLLKILCGLLSPECGECRVFGQISKKRKPELLQDIYYIPEAFYLPDITISQFKERFSPFYPKFDNNFFIDKIKQLELDNTKNLAALSYGEKKKFILAFALATRAKLVIFDEPTNGLDIIVQRELKKILIEAYSEERTFLISTHHIKEFENVLDSLVIIDNGNILLSSSLDILNNSFNIEIVNQLDQKNMPIYYEEIPGGYVVLNQNKDLENNIDISFFFKAVIYAAEKINHIILNSQEPARSSL